MREKITLFAAALSKAWWALMSCAAFTLLSVWSSLARNGNQITIVGTTILALLFFLIASFKAWSDENKKFEEAAKKNERPDLSIELGDVLTYYNLESNVTVVCAAVVVTNRGAASPAQGWKARFSSPRIDVTIGYSNLPSLEFPWALSNGHLLILRRPDMLPARTLNAIERGHTTHGRILFEFPGDIRPELGNFVGRLWIGCQDFQGTLVQQVFQGYPITQTNFFPDEETRPPQLDLQLDAALNEMLGVPPNQ